MKAALRTIFLVFGMTRPRIEPLSPGPLVNTLPTRPWAAIILGITVSVFFFFWLEIAVLVDYFQTVSMFLMFSSFIDFFFVDIIC